MIDCIFPPLRAFFKESLWGSEVQTLCKKSYCLNYLTITRTSSGLQLTCKQDERVQLFHGASEDELQLLMPSGPQTPGAAADPAHPSVRVSFPASVYPPAETGVLTCFVGAPDVSFISVLI